MVKIISESALSSLQNLNRRKTASHLPVNGPLGFRRLSHQLSHRRGARLLAAEEDDLAEMVFRIFAFRDTNLQSPVLETKLCSCLRKKLKKCLIK
jgi:hypothetical protein